MGTYEGLLLCRGSKGGTITVSRECLLCGGTITVLVELLLCRAQRGKLLLCRPLLASGTLCICHYFRGLTVGVRGQGAAASTVLGEAAAWYCYKCSRI